MRFYRIISHGPLIWKITKLFLVVFVALAASTNRKEQTRKTGEKEIFLFSSKKSHKSCRLRREEGSEEAFLINDSYRRKAWMERLSFWILPEQEAKRKRANCFCGLDRLVKNVNQWIPQLVKAKESFCSDRSSSSPSSSEGQANFFVVIKLSFPSHARHPHPPRLWSLFINCKTSNSTFFIRKVFTAPGGFLIGRSTFLSHKMSQSTFKISREIAGKSFSGDNEAEPQSRKSIWKPSNSAQSWEGMKAHN